jgi:hypothetical protein
MMKTDFSESFLDMLSQIDDSCAPTRLYGLDERECELRLRNWTEPVLTSLGLPDAVVDAYRCYVDHLGRNYRRWLGPELTFYIRLAVVVWAAQGLEFCMLEALARLVHDRARTFREVQVEAPALVVSR